MTQIIPRRALIAALIAGPLAVGTLAGCATQGMTTDDTTATPTQKKTYTLPKPIVCFGAILCGS